VNALHAWTVPNLLLCDGRHVSKYERVSERAGLGVESEHPRLAFIG